jgi:hypothetical protein
METRSKPNVWAGSAFKDLFDNSENKNLKREP